MAIGGQALHDRWRNTLRYRLLRCNCDSVQRRSTDLADYGFAQAALRSLWKFCKLWQIIGDGEPRRFARDINMHLRPDAGIVI
jgi:hypothetical protein